MCHVLTQVIRTIKTFIKYKSATAGKFITKNTNKQCRMLRLLGLETKKQLVKSKVSSINYPYFEKKFEFLL